MSVLAIRNGLRQGLRRDVFIGNSCGVRVISKDGDKMQLKNRQILQIFPAPDPRTVFIDQLVKKLAPGNDSFKNLGLNLFNPNTFGIVWYGATEPTPVSPVMPELDSTYDEFHFEDQDGLWGFEGEEEEPTSAVVADKVKTSSTPPESPVTKQ